MKEATKSFDTTVFKTCKDLPTGTYPYAPDKGDGSAGKGGKLPNDTSNYKGDKVGSENGIPKSSYTYKGEKAGKAAN